MSTQDKANDDAIKFEEENVATTVDPTTTTVNEDDKDVSKPPPPPKEVQEAITQVVNNATVNATEVVPPTLDGPVKTLKDAFPDIDTDIIEVILQNNNGNVDRAFETLLGMSDPNYKPEETSERPVQQQDDQMQKDEALARQLVAEEANGQNRQVQDNEPLFNFQEDLPAIKEKAIELGTAAKNKIMSFYNQLMSGESMSAGNTMTADTNQGSNTLERDLGNLNISDNQNTQRPQPPLPQPQQQRQRGSVDLYEWNGQPVDNTPPVPTSTSNDQLLADEEFARQLAREDAEAAAAATNSVAVATTAPQSVPAESPPVIAKNINVGPLKSGKLELAKDNSSNQEEVTFTTPDDQGKVKGFTIDDEDDDLDDLFIRDDSNADTKSDSKSDSKSEPKSEPKSEKK